MANRYLQQTDYNVVIQNIQSSFTNNTSQLSQIVQGNQNTLLQAENYAIAEVYSILNQKYLLDLEFQNTSNWSYGATYTPSNRVYNNYATYSNSVTYSIGNCVTVGTECYCLTGTNSFAGTFSSQYWTDIGSLNQYYYVTYPAPYFNYMNYYKAGSIVYYAGTTWSCNITTFPPSQIYAEQFISINKVPRNTIPTDKANANNTFWSPGQPYITPVAGQTYSIGTASVGTYTIYDTLPTNSKFWTVGDNRSQMMVMYLTQMVIYYLDKNLSPTNVPEHRVKAYKEAIEYFKDVAFGRRSTPILPIQPEQGDTFRYGGNVRSGSNSW